MSNHVSSCWVASLLLFLAGLATWSLETTQSVASDVSPPTNPEPLAQTIQGLIQQLGADEYAQREKAQAELEQLGLIAYDAIRAAVKHDDIEIALRAQYLLRIIPDPWIRDSDPREVRELLRNFGEKTTEDRLALIEQLNTIPADAGIPALCRIACFDPSNILSKKSALMILQSRRHSTADAHADVPETIRKEIGYSDRSAARWLRLYSRTLVAPQSTVDEWAKFVQDEQRLLANRPDQTSPDIVLGLIRWQVDLLQHLGRTEESRELLRSTLDGADSDQSQLIDTIDWLTDREDWSMVLEVAERFPQSFQQSVDLSYRLAEAHLKLGQTERAEQLAQQALMLGETDIEKHILVGFDLQERGLYDWAECEYRHAIGLGPVENPGTLKSRLFLSEMLHDLERDSQAAEVLMPVADLCENNKGIAASLKDAGRDPAGMIARIHFFLSEHHRRQGKLAQQAEELEKAIEHDPTDADVLIAMYRYKDADEAWKRETVARIEKAADEFRRQIRMAEAYVARTVLERERAEVEKALAAANNQLAWLISNTTGNFQEALRSSQRSLELRPGTAGYLDTLGRCYYALGDIEAALRYQRRAAELEPHTMQIRRQLELFEKAWNDRDATRPAADHVDSD